jgi:hypothetical protein
MRILERAVLELLLEQRPAHLSIDEVVRALTVRPENFSEREPIECALVSLRGDGLLHSNGPFWFPTRAASRFDELQQDC